MRFEDLCVRIGEMVVVGFFDSSVVNGCAFDEQ